MLRDERGSATVWTIGAIAALLVVAALVLSLGAVVVSRQRASDAADLAALAAAGSADQGVDAACERARAITARMAVGLVSCRLDGWDALVEVAAAVPGGLGDASAHARAGPVAR